MLITYLRSSSLKTYTGFCQMQYFLTYVLGLPYDVKKSADKGTIVHKVLELLAIAKKQFQESGKNQIVLKDPNLNIKYNVRQSDFLKPYTLQNEEVEKINKTRINKYNYCHPCKLDYGHVRYGVDLVEYLIDKVFTYYSEKTTHEWKPVDLKDITNWVWMALEYQDGLYDPRKKNIVSPEPHFDISIDKEWAQYEWKIDGKTIKGNLAIKGTIDLVTKINDDTYEICDIKTGSRVDWNSKNKDRKTYKKLCQDEQLMLYYYAARKMYPDIKHVIMTIFWVRDGGPFSICMDDYTLDQVEEILKNTFEKIKADDLPKMIDPKQKGDKCTKFCSYYKQDSPDNTNICKFIHEQLKSKGMDYVVKHYKDPGHNIHFYDAPGE